MKHPLFVAGVLALAACPGAHTARPPEPPVSTTTPEPAPTTEPVPTNPDPAKPFPGPRPHPAPRTLAQVFAERCPAGLHRAQAMLPELLARTGPRTLDSFLDPFNDLLLAVKDSEGQAGLMSNVHPDPDVRAAARACEQEVESFENSLLLNHGLYEAFAAVDVAALDPEARRMVEHRLRDFRRAGVDRDEATRKRLTELDDEITRLGQEFVKNMDEDVRSIEIDSPAGLAGLPADFVASHQPGPDGKIKVTTQYPDLFPFMTYAESSDLRKALYVASVSRGGEANDKVLQQLLEKRYEKARLLGYADWADYDTEILMMKSGKDAAAFIDRVSKITGKRMRRDVAELLAAKRKDHPGAKVVEAWERAYYDNKVKADKYNFDAQEVRPYFEYEAVEKGLLDTTAQMYGVRYERVPDADVWDDSVKAYDVFQDDHKLGRIYLDMHPRAGKYGHAAAFDFVTGIPGKQLPEGTLVCNFPDPRTSQGPALMEHDDVETMFHEFGHLMHHIFGSQTHHWVDLAGIQTERDFVEAPSQMFEEWAWNEDVLARFAKHYQTGEVIPRALVDRMRKARDFGKGTYARQQMFYAALSLELHRGDPHGRSITDTVRRLQTKLTPYPYVEGVWFQSSFGHLNGYSAHYYTYMWSLVIAKDLLTPFMQHGLMNPEWDQRWRDVVLGQGGAKDAAQLVADFLGRPLSFKAFEEYLAG